MAGFEAWRAGEAQSTRPRAPHPSERPHSCTCWGKHLNGNNVKFHSYLMSSDLTGPRGKDRSKMIVLDKFLKAKKSNRQTLQKRRLRNEKKKTAHKTAACCTPCPAPARALGACLPVYLCIYLFVHGSAQDSRCVCSLSNTHRSSSISTVPEPGRKKFTEGEETGETTILNYLINLKQLFLMLKENETG